MVVYITLNKITIPEGMVYYNLYYIGVHLIHKTTKILQHTTYMQPTHTLLLFAESNRGGPVLLNGIYSIAGDKTIVTELSPP